MLDRCFLHLPGVGPAFELKLREHGINCWEDALKRELPCGDGRAAALRAGIEESLERLEANDGSWFEEKLPTAELWRLFPHFGHSAAFVDIETTGSWDWMKDHGCCITTIALYDGESVRTYVQGENLESFADDILDYALLVTWNGRGFDAPILRRVLNIPLDKSGSLAHLDLLPVFRAMNLRGGLKKVEKRLGIDRDELDGVDGLAAVRLWEMYCRTGNRRALDTLLAYNVADVLSLEYLARYAVAHHCGDGEITPPPPVRYDLNPHCPDMDILNFLYPAW